MEERNYKIIWPAYIDASKTRKEGRKVNLKYAVEKVKISEIENALKSLKIQYEIFLDKAYPKSWWEKGYVKVINVEQNKQELLKKICILIKKLRNFKNI